MKCPRCGGEFIMCGRCVRCAEQVPVPGVYGLMALGRHQELSETLVIHVCNSLEQFCARMHRETYDDEFELQTFRLGDADLESMKVMLEFVNARVREERR